MKIQPVKKDSIRKPTLNNVITAPQPINRPDYDPGRTLGIIGFVLAFVGAGIIGLILSIIGYQKSKAVGIKNGLALAGIWLNSISIVVFSIIILSAITIVSYTGITVRANTSQAQSNAMTTQSYAEVYFVDNNRYPDKKVDFDADGTPSLDMSSDISLLNSSTTTLNKSNGLTTIWYQYTGDVNAATGGRIMYWDFTNSKISVYYLGDATASSTFTDLQ